MADSIQERLEQARSQPDDRESPLDTALPDQTGTVFSRKLTAYEQPDYPVGGAFGETSVQVLTPEQRVAAVMVGLAAYRETDGNIPDNLRNWLAWMIENDRLVQATILQGVGGQGKPFDTRSAYGTWSGGEILPWPEEVTKAVNAAFDADAIYSIAKENNDDTMLKLFFNERDDIERFNVRPTEPTWNAQLQEMSPIGGFPIVFGNPAMLAGAGAEGQYLGAMWGRSAFAASGGATTINLFSGVSSGLNASKGLLAHIVSAAQKFHLAHPNVIPMTRNILGGMATGGLIRFFVEQMDITINPDEYPEFEREVAAAAGINLDDAIVADAERDEETQLFTDATNSTREQLGLPPIEETGELEVPGLGTYATDPDGNFILNEYGQPMLITELEYLDDPYVGFETKDPGETIYRGERPRIGGESAWSYRDEAWYSRPTYRVSDVEQFLNQMTPGQLASFTARAIRAGLIDPDSTMGGMAFVEGVHSPHLITAAQNLFAVTNRSKEQDWNLVLDRMILANQERERENRPKFTWAIYPTPDPATFRQEAREAVETRLGRRIRDYELDMLVERQSADDRAAFDAQQQLAHEQYLFEGRIRELEDIGMTTDEYTIDADELGLPGAMPGESYTIPAAGSQPPPSSAVQVDPAARFDEFFRQKFGKEEDRARRTARVQVATQNLMAGLRRAGGG